MMPLQEKAAMLLPGLFQSMRHAELRRKAVVRYAR